MQQDSTAEIQAASHPAIEEDSQIVARQNFVLGCDEMARITDDIIVAEFLNLAKQIRDKQLPMDITLMDCESPLDGKLYNVGVRLDFTYQDVAMEVSLVADPSDFSFTFAIEGLSEVVSQELKFHEVVPLTLQRVISEHFDKHFPEVGYAFTIGENDQLFDNFQPPFRVLYDDGENVSDVATTKTLLEAANMGSTFAKMFKKEDAISILDSAGTVIC